MIANSNFMITDGKQIVREGTKISPHNVTH